MVTGLTFRIHQHGVEFPEEIKEVVCKVSDGYMICLNSRLTETEMKREYYHALMHIIHDDFTNPDVRYITEATHRVCDLRWGGNNLRLKSKECSEYLYGFNFTERFF